MAKLGELCKIQSGGTPSRANPAYWEGGQISWVKISDIKSKHLDSTEEHITELGLKNSSAKIFPAGTILYTIFATLGETCILDIDAATNQAIAGLQVESDLILPNYLYYYLLSQKANVSVLGRGVAQNNINMKMLKDFDVPLPPLDEQRRIAAVLDKVTDLIAQRRAQLDKLDLLVKSRFVEMFGDPEYNNKNWEIVPLSTVCSVGSSKRIYQNEQSPQGIPFLRISDLMNLINTGTLTTNLYIPEKKYKELQLKGQVPKSGDILVTSRGTLGQCYIIKDYDKFYFQDGMISWLSAFKDNITPLYLSYLFAMPGFHKQIDAMQAGSTVSYLSISMIKSLKVMVPNIKVQQDFTEFVKQMKNLEYFFTQGLRQLEMLKKALMQQYFE